MTDEKKTGRQLADEGGLLALNHAELESMGWGERAERAVRYYVMKLKSGETFTVEQLKVWAYSRGLPNPPADGAWGPIIRRVAKTNLISRVGYQESANASQHGKLVTIWGKN